MGESQGQEEVCMEDRTDLNVELWGLWCRLFALQRHAENDL